MGIYDLFRLIISHYKALHRSSCGSEGGSREAFALSTSIHGGAETVFNRNRQESHMNRSLTAVVLCIVTQAAAAQCVAAAPVVQQMLPAANLVKTKTVVATPPVGGARSGGELIKTAAAGTHDQLPGISRTTAASGAGAGAGAHQDDQPRHSGSAMLLTALALMSGIALRRFGAHKQ